MAQFILKLFNMSISAGYLVLAVLLLRTLLKNAPKWMICILWGIVALRLLLPFTPVSSVSLIPSAQIFPADITTAHTPAIQSGIASVNGAVNPLLAQSSVNHNPTGDLIAVAAVIWAIGAAVMLLCSVISYLRLRRRVRICLRYQKNIYLCDSIPSPFLFGVLLPKIYVPSDTPEQLLPYILAHEQTHIRRGDHLWKPLGFLLLSFHWFNPLMWVAYILLCRDIEQACDEQVISPMDNQGRLHYSEALLSCSLHRRMIMTCPVAFGSVSVKERIRGIVNYKKPTFWILAVTALACCVAAVCFLTDPLPCKHTYTATMMVAPTCTETGVQTHSCSLCKYQYTAPVEKLPHNYDSGTVRITPSCIRFGEEEFTCADCGHKTINQLEKTGHTPGQLTVTKEPDCTHTGEESSVCTVCDVTFVANILPTNDTHDLVQTVVRAATCADPGEGKNTCSRCGYEESCTLEKLSHTYRVGMVSDGCPNSTGLKQMICVDCGNEQWYDTGYGTEHQYSDSLYFSTCYLCHMPNPNNKSPYQTSTSLLDSVTYTSQNNSYLDQNPVFPDPTPDFPKPTSTSTKTTQTVTPNLPVIRIWP